MSAALDPHAERPWKRVSYLVLEAAKVELTATGVRLPFKEPSGETRYWRVKVRDREWFEPRPSDVGGLIPYGLETLPDVGDDSCVFVAEGESDCLAIRESFAEWGRYPGGVCAIALPGANSWRRAWRDYLARFPTIFLVPDGDEAGARMARAVRRDLPWSRVVLLPHDRDVRFILQAGGAKALLPFLDDAECRSRWESALGLSRSGRYVGDDDRETSVDALIASRGMAA